MQLTMLPTQRRLVLVGPDCGRGPCSACGCIAELVQAHDGERLLDVCAPCAAKPRVVFVARAA